jgi:hypothetical protein
VAIYVLPARQDATSRPVLVLCNQAEELDCLSQSGGWLWKVGFLGTRQNEAGLIARLKEFGDQAGFVTGQVRTEAHVVDDYLPLSGGEASGRTNVVTSGTIGSPQFGAGRLALISGGCLKRP